MELCWLFVMPGVGTLSICRAAFADSLITPDFRLHQPDYTLKRRGFDIDADTLGNFYVTWNEGENSGVGRDGHLVVTRIRHDGTINERLVVLSPVRNGDSTQGFERPTGTDVSPSGSPIAVQYSRFFDQPFPSAVSGTRMADLPPYMYSFLQLMDSSGLFILPEVWIDSLVPGVKAHPIGPALFGSGFSAVWEAYVPQGDRIGTYAQSFDAAGNRLDSISRIDTCTESITCLWGQSKRRDSWHGGFVVTWDELVEELGTGEQRPVFRIYDSLGQPISPVLAAAYEPGYVADCGGSSPGYQSGYFPDVACAENGEFMLVWASCDGLVYGAFGAKPWGQIYHADGTPKSGLILLADTPPHDAIDIKVTQGDDGNYYAVWADARYSCATCWYPLDVFVQKVSSDGELIGHNYIINDARFQVANGYDVDMAVSRGRACVIWRYLKTYSVPPANDGEFYGQVVSVDLIGNFLHGDVNLDYRFTSGDIIYLVNYVFKSGQSPQPGLLYGDVTGDCVTNAADIIYYVNYVFKGGAAFREPCGE